MLRPGFVLKCWLLIVLMVGSGLVACSRHRYDYQQAEAGIPPTALMQASEVSFGDRYRVPAETTLTHQAPFTPNLADNLVIPRPVPMHNRLVEQTTNLRLRGHGNQAFAELLPDARARASLRVDAPGELVGRSLVELLREQGAAFTQGSADQDAKMRADCSLLYQLTSPEETTICIYTTLRSSFVVAIAADEDDQNAIDYGGRLLAELLKRLG